MSSSHYKAAAPVTAIVTAYKRIPQTLETLKAIADTNPPPAEILVHVDDNRHDCAAAVKEAFPEVEVLLSSDNVGPGGGRNRLIASAKSPYIASFDDDSYPMHEDYFAKVVSLFEQYPGASILAAEIIHRGEPYSKPFRKNAWVGNFVGCGCAYRKSALVGLEGYVPLPIAYGMEEVDFSLRLIDQGGRILQTPSLQVFHDTDRSHYIHPDITAYSIANLALLAFLRYPVLYWPVGAAQVLTRVKWLILAKHFKGIFKGLSLIPGHVYAHRHFRDTVSHKGFWRFFVLRRRRIPA